MNVANFLSDRTKPKTLPIAHPGNMTLSLNNKGFEDIIFYLRRTAAACCGCVIVCTIIKLQFW